MKFLLIIPLVLFVLSCEDEETDTPDTTPPTVSISSHSSGQSVNEIITITVTTQDNEGISRVEFFIDDSLHFTDTESPYQYNWNTTAYEDTSHTVKVISYDTSDNSTPSQPISYLIDNSESHPTPVELYPITYQDGSFTITWSQNNDVDFSSYELYESMSEDMSGQTLIYETDVKTDTTFVVTGINNVETRYYQVVVEDVWGLQSVSNIQYGSSYTLFVKTFGGSDYAVGYSVQKINDNGYIIVGVKDWRGCLIKTDINGNEK